MKYSLAYTYPSKRKAQEVADRWRDRYYMRVRRLKGGWGMYKGRMRRLKDVWGVYQGERKRKI